MVLGADREALFVGVETGAAGDRPAFEDAVDLEAQEIRGPDGGAIRFEIDPFRKRCMMEGLDDIGLTLEKADAIEAFERASQAQRPWV